MDKDINSLLAKPLWQLTGSDYVALHAYACSVYTAGPEASQVIRVKGVHDLAQYLCCSESQVYKLLRAGVLESAILFKVGKSIVFNGEVALKCAADYQEQQRITRRLTK